MKYFILGSFASAFVLYGIALIYGATATGPDQPGTTNIALIAARANQSLYPPLLFAGITVISAIGVYSLNRNAFDLVVVFVLGAIGFLLKRYDYPLGPVILGIQIIPAILGAALFVLVLRVLMGASRGRTAV